MQLHKKLLLITVLASVTATATPIYALESNATTTDTTSTADVSTGDELNIGLTTVDSTAEPLIVSTLGNDPDWDNEDAYKKYNQYYQDGWAGQCTWFALGRFYEIYGFDGGFRGNGQNCVDQLIEAHGDLFEKSDTPVAGAVFSLVGGEYGHVGIVTAVYDDGSFDIQDCNVSSVIHPEEPQSLPAKYKGDSQITGMWRTTHISGVDDYMWLTGEGNLPYVRTAVFANPKNAMTQEMFDEWKMEQTTDVTVSAAWNGIDPAKSYEVHLTANGEDLVVIKLNKAMKWKYTFKDLPEYYEDSNEPVEYSITYAAPDGTTVARSGDAENGFVIEISKKE